MFGEDVVGIAGNGGAVGDKVGHGLHDVPGIFPPGESGQEPELQRHVPQPAVHEEGGAPLGSLR